MKFLKNKVTAIVLSALVIVGCLSYGQLQKPKAETHQSIESVSVLDVSDYDGSGYEVWSSDEAGMISSSTEKLVDSYNAKWDANYGTILALVTVDSTGRQDIEDYAFQTGQDKDLTDKDSLLLLVKRGNNYQFLYSDLVGDAVGDSRLDDICETALEPDFASGDYDSAVREFYASLDKAYERYMGQVSDSLYYSMNSKSRQSSAGISAAGLITLLVLGVVAVSMIDRRRYRRWYRSYGAGGVNPVAFAPLLFWHRPGGSWTRRMDGRLRTPPPPPRGSYGGNRSSANRGGGFGGPGPGSASRGSGFSGSSRGSGFGSSSRSGGFGGSRSSGGSSTRSGGFSSGSSSRSGGFGGSRSSSGRSGGFGGRR